MLFFLHQKYLLVSLFITADQCNNCFV